MRAPSSRSPLTTLAFLTPYQSFAFTSWLLLASLASFLWWCKNYLELGYHGGLLLNFSPAFLSAPIHLMLASTWIPHDAIDVSRSRNFASPHIEMLHPLHSDSLDWESHIPQTWGVFARTPGNDSQSTLTLRCSGKTPHNCPALGRGLLVPCIWLKLPGLWEVHLYHLCLGTADPRLPDCLSVTLLRHRKSLTSGFHARHHALTGLWWDQGVKNRKEEKMEHHIWSWKNNNFPILQSVVSTALVEFEVGIYLHFSTYFD